jgi:phosphohistidine phosphatase
MSVKKVYIIRHAKSSWKDETLDDFERTLNKRGKSNAVMMGSLLKEKNIMPDIILSSPAKRAKITAEIIAKKVDYLKDIVFDDGVYESTQSKLHKILTKVDDKNGILFLVGHNPSLNMLVEGYVELNENIPTCGVVEIEFECDKWADIDAKNAKLISFDYPKKHSLMR